MGRALGREIDHQLAVGKFGEAGSLVNGGEGDAHFN
jgi:hypothetical protein